MPSAVKMMMHKIGKLPDKEIIKSLLEWLDAVNWEEFYIEGTDDEFKIKKVKK